MILLTILAYILLLLLVILAAIIFIPYHYHAAGENVTQSQIEGSISWFFGGIKLLFTKKSRQKSEMTLVIMGLTRKINISQNSGDQKGKKPNHGKDARNSKSKKRFRIRQYLRSDVINKVMASFLKILRHCQPKTLSVNVKVGFYDPMYTGFLCALLSQCHVILNKHDVLIQTVFDEEVVEGSFLIGGRIWLPHLILIMIGLVITKPIRNILFTSFKLKKNKGGHQYAG